MVKKTIIQATKKLGKELIKEASLEHKLRVCAYVRVSTIIGEYFIKENEMRVRYRFVTYRQNAHRQNNTESS